jgi:hypothetical protein
MGWFQLRCASKHLVLEHLLLKHRMSENINFWQHSRISKIVSFGVTRTQIRCKTLEWYCLEPKWMTSKKCILGSRKHWRNTLDGTGSFDRITFLRNSFFSFESRSFEFFLFLTFFRIRVLLKLSPILKERYSDKLPLPVQNRWIDRIHSFEQPSYRA